MGTRKSVSTGQRITELALVVILLLGGVTPASATSVSPLRHAIVFSRFLPDADQGELYRIDAHGTVAHLVRSVNDAAILSPSGTRFLDFAPTSDDRASTAIFNVDGTGYHVLPVNDPSLGLPGGQWLSGDSMIAMEGWGPDGDPHGVSIYARRASDGGGLIKLTDAGSRHDYPVRSSPDGAKLLFFRPDARGETSDSAVQDVFVVSADGHDSKRINPPGTTTAFVFSGDAVSWSPSSKRLAMVLSQGRFWDNRNRSVSIANVDGSDLHRIGPSGDIWEAVWSPDGEWIALTMASNATSGLHELFLMHPDGTCLHALTSSAGGLDALRPTWSPDGSQIMFARGTGDPHNSDLWSIDVDGSHLYRITYEPGEYRAAAWLP